MNEHPPAHIILSARYLERKPKQADVEQQMGELAGVIGKSARPTPAHLREAMEWAEKNKPKKWRRDAR